MLCGMMLALPALGQTISSSLPANIRAGEKYLFYFHGGVVTVRGDNAINDGAPEWGRYEYLNILDSLRKRGYNVISENRKPNVDDSVYVERVVAQVDSLVKRKVPPKNIMLVGASAGSDIVMRASTKMPGKAISYVIMGGCWPSLHKNYQAFNLNGRFLSVIEKSDPRGPCAPIFINKKQIPFEEVTLNMGLSHGFIYRGYKEWIDPIVAWHKEQSK